MASLSIWHWAIVGVLGWMLFSAFNSRRSSAQTYVIKEWFASEAPNQEGIYVSITGRKGGLMSFFMSLVGIDPTVSLVVDRENVRFKRGSWAGYSAWVTPLNKLCSGQYGYSKPFWSVVLWIVIGTVLLLPSFGVSLILILGAIAYYFLNKTLVLGLTFVGGANVYSGDALAFKRSVIEGKNIDEFATERIVAIIEMIVRGAEKPRALSADSGHRATATENLNRAANELNTAAEFTRQRTEALAAQARQMGERIAAKVSATLAASSATVTPTAAPVAQVEGSLQAPPSVRPASVCPNCLRPVTDRDTFCGECGFKMT
jgi:hypothetical protein